MSGKRAAAYVRLSKLRKGDEDKALSPETQLATCRLKALAAGFELDESLITYDLDESAFSQPWKKRAGFVKLVDMARRGEIDAIVVSRLDRFARRSSETLEVVELLKGGGARLLAGDFDVDVETANGRFTLQLMASLAERESAVIAERVTAAALTRATSGKSHGGTPPMWLRREPDGTWAINEDVAPAFREMTHLRAAGHGFTSITRQLNDRGLLRADGRPWFVQHISRYLRDDFLDTMGTGAQYFHRRTYDNKRRKGWVGDPIRVGSPYPTIIDEATMRAAQEMNAITRVPGQKKRGDAATYLLAGLLKCSSCGFAMKGGSNANGTRYNCTAVGLPGHQRQSMLRDQVEDAVLRVVGLLAKGEAQALRSPRRSAESVERQIANLMQRLERQKDLYELGDLSKDEYMAKRSALKAEIERLGSPSQDDAIPDITPEMDRIAIRSALRKFVVSVVGPKFNDAWRSTNGSPRPYVTVTFRHNGWLMEFDAPLYRATWQGDRHAIMTSLKREAPSPEDGDDTTAAVHKLYAQFAAEDEIRFAQEHGKGSRVRRLEEYQERVGR